MTKPLNEAQDTSGPVGRETRILIDKIGIALSFLLMALAIVGEVLGWWNELGLLLGAASLLIGVLSLLDVSGTRLLDALLGLHERFDRQDDVLASLVGGQQALVGGQRSMVDNQEAMLDNQAGLLDRQDATIDRLDRIAEILDDRLPT